jgi:hypothetical protein
MPPQPKSKGALRSKQAEGVFLNVPFDAGFVRFFRAAVFTIEVCGYDARCALETSDSGTPRLHRILELIRECRLSLHDFSRIKADPYPRFNMPFELGLVLGAGHFGGKLQKQKKCLVLATKRYQYQKIISDISGQDIKNHQNQIGQVIACVRDFLRGHSGKRSLPGAAKIIDLYKTFKRKLPLLCRQPELQYDFERLHFEDYKRAIFVFLKNREKSQEI